MTAFVLGNGISRAAITVEQLQAIDSVYGCNALYRTHTPDVLVATDPLIATAIQESGYSLRNRFYTRRPIPGLGAHAIVGKRKGYSSGPNAVAIAADDGHKKIYLLGFDMAPTTAGTFNNVYAGTEFYKAADAAPTFAGNWQRQLCQIFADFPQTQFVHVQGKTTADIADFAQLPNVKTMTIEQLQQQINTAPKDL